MATAVLQAMRILVPDKTLAEECGSGAIALVPSRFGDQPLKTDDLLRVERPGRGGRGL